MANRFFAPIKIDIFHKKYRIIFIKKTFCFHPKKADFFKGINQIFSIEKNTDFFMENFIEKNLIFITKKPDFFCPAKSDFNGSKKSDYFQ